MELRLKRLENRYVLWSVLTVGSTDYETGGRMQAFYFVECLDIILLGIVKHDLL